jgi:hypothetical protein
MPPPFHMRKAHLRAFCPECQQLQDQLNAGTDSIVELLNKKCADPNETLPELSKALDERDQVIRKFVEHLKTHEYAA